MDANEITAFLTALASLIVAFTALIKVLQTLNIATKTHAVAQANREDDRTHRQRHQWRAPGPEGSGGRPAKHRATTARLPRAWR